MILHIITDDKFPDKGIENFNRALPGQNRTLIVTQDEKFKYLKLIPDVILKERQWYLNHSFIKEIRNSSTIVLHHLCIVGLMATLIAQKSKKILWIGWGADYYNQFEKKGYQLYGWYTKELLEKKANKKINHFKKMIKTILFNHAIKRINIFSPVILEDYELFNHYFPKSKMIYMPWNYGINNSQAPVDIQTDYNLGPNILVGNSASYTNNHLEVFEILKHINLGQRKIIIPLSYGDPEYRDYIIKIGKDLFHDSFVPLVDFIPIDDYHKILQSCSIVIMNHYRQQAAGNIYMMLRLGAKVYLSERSPYYKATRRMNQRVFLIETLETNPMRLLEPLSAADKIHNIRLFQESNQQNIINEQTRDIINLLLS